jgi:hypothetical protein
MSQVVSLVKTRTYITIRAKEIVKEYSDHEGGAALLIGTKAGNVGLNITCATKVIMLEAEWNPGVSNKRATFHKLRFQALTILSKVVIQAYSRAYRLGQTNDVTVEILLMENTIDMHIFLKSMMRLERNNFIEEAAFFHPCILGWEDLTDFSPPADLVEEGYLQIEEDIELRYP